MIEIVVVGFATIGVSLFLVLKIFSKDECFDCGVELDESSTCATSLNDRVCNSCSLTDMKS